MVPATTTLGRAQPLAPFQSKFLRARLPINAAAAARELTVGNQYVGVVLRDELTNTFRYAAGKIVFVEIGLIDKCPIGNRRWDGSRKTIFRNIEIIQACRQTNFGRQRSF